jgi:hypothetical protein
MLQVFSFGSVALKCSTLDISLPVRLLQTNGKRRSFEVGKYHRKSVVTLGCINIYIYLI